MRDRTKRITHTLRDGTQAYCMFFPKRIDYYNQECTAFRYRHGGHDLGKIIVKRIECLTDEEIEACISEAVEAERTGNYIK